MKLVVTFLVALATGVAAIAQDFPAKPVRMLVSFPPGGSADLTGRVLAQGLQELWGQSVIVENRGGSGGIAATEMAAKAAPDGYTLFLATDGPFVINPFVYKSLPYDPLGDFAPVALVARVPLALVAHPSVPATNLREFIALAKKSREPLNYASSGSGGPHHLAMEALKAATGIELNHIPYKGGAPALQDVVAGRVPVMFSGLSTSLPHWKAGKLKIFAVGTANRSSLAPEIPTVAELGFPGFEAGAWAGIVVPRAVPSDIVERIERDVRRVVETRTFRERLAATGNEPLAGSSEEFRALIRRDYERNQKLTRTLNLRPE